MRARRGVAVELALAAAAVACLVVGFHRPAYVATPFAPVPKEPGVVRIVTWNVGHVVGAGSAPLGSDELEHVAERLARLDADVVVLQELRDERQARGLRRRLGRGWEHAAAADAGTSRVAVLARGDVEAFAVAAAGGRVVGATVDLPGGPALAVLGVHADAFSSRARNATVGAALDALLERDEPARVLAGDLNVDLDLGKRRDLFTDDEHLDVETYNYVASALLDAARGTGSTAEPDRRLDYVFVADDALRVLRAGPWKGQRGEGMDHDPVVADVIRR